MVFLDPANLDAKFRIKFLASELLSFAVPRVISPGLVGRFGIEFDNGNALAVRCRETLESDKPGHGFGQLLDLRSQFVILRHVFRFKP